MANGNPYSYADSIPSVADIISIRKAINEQQRVIQDRKDREAAMDAGKAAAEATAKYAQERGQIAEERRKGLAELTQNTYGPQTPQGQLTIDQKIDAYKAETVGLLNKNMQEQFAEVNNYFTPLAGNPYAERMQEHFVRTYMVNLQQQNQDMQQQTAEQRVDLETNRSRIITMETERHNRAMEHLQELNLAETRRGRAAAAQREDQIPYAIGAAALKQATDDADKIFAPLPPDASEADTAAHYKDIETALRKLGVTDAELKAVAKDPAAAQRLFIKKSVMRTINTARQTHGQSPFSEDKFDSILGKTPTESEQPAAPPVDTIRQTEQNVRRKRINELRSRNEELGKQLGERAAAGNKDKVYEQGYDLYIKIRDALANADENTDTQELTNELDDLDRSLHPILGSIGLYGYRSGK